MFCLLIWQEGYDIWSLHRLEIGHSVKILYKYITDKNLQDKAVYCCSPIKLM